MPMPSQPPFYPFYTCEYALLDDAAQALPVDAADLTASVELDLANSSGVIVLPPSAVPGRIPC